MRILSIEELAPEKMILEKIKAFITVYDLVGQKTNRNQRKSINNNLPAWKRLSCYV